MPRFPRTGQISAEDIAPFVDGGRFECAHCRLRATAQALYGATAQSVSGALEALGQADQHPRFTITVAVCAGCDEATVLLRKSKREFGAGDTHEVTEWTKQVEPVGRAPKQFPAAPPSLMRSYQEACKTLTLSASASACMSRRCLQELLALQGYAHRVLAKQIDALLEEGQSGKALPPDLFDSVDAIRSFGNFGAHPLTDLTSLQIVEVEEQEAEWCIELCEQLVEHYYQRPAALQSRREAANNKLKAVGKPPLRSRQSS